jgi:outer membrane receptor for ferrienterochelin and colicins
MTRYYLIAFLCAPMSVMGGGEARAVEPIEEDIEQVYGRDEDTISIATGYRKPLDLAPSVATVITEDDIQAIGATTLGQVIETVAGIHVSTTNVVDSVVTVRGITSRVLVLLNNVPVAQGLFVNAFAQLDNIQINDIERIEVIRGPGSAVHGADAFHGGGLNPCRDPLIRAAFSV